MADANPSQLGLGGGATNAAQKLALAGKMEQNIPTEIAVVRKADGLVVRRTHYDTGTVRETHVYPGDFDEKKQIARVAVVDETVPQTAQLAQPGQETILHPATAPNQPTAAPLPLPSVQAADLGPPIVTQDVGTGIGVATGEGVGDENTASEGVGGIGQEETAPDFASAGEPEVEAEVEAETTADESPSPPPTRTAKRGKRSG